jgi:hypothetical protein
MLCRETSDALETKHGVASSRDPDTDCSDKATSTDSMVCIHTSLKQTIKKPGTGAGLGI